MTATKLRELLEAASPGPWIWGDITVQTENAEIRLASDMDAKLAALAPDLARLVLELSEALPQPEKLENLAVWLDYDDQRRDREGDDEVQNDLRSWASTARAALAAVEEL